MTTESCGRRLRQKIERTRANESVLPFIGIYDVFSASLAAKSYDALFVSGFGFAASHYGLPDVGFIAWPDIVAFVTRVRTILPQTHLLVDMDDGYCDTEVACHVVSLLEAAGASGVVLEDQQRPRRCGHFDGKQITPLDDYLEKLNRVLETRRELFVVARTDASETDDILRRVCAFEATGADAILVDGIKDFNLIKTIRQRVSCPITFNQIAGGKSPRCDLKELAKLGVSMAIYSTPCLFAAQNAIESALHQLKNDNGLLPQTGANIGVGVPECNAHLQENLQRRHAK